MSELRVVCHLLALYSSLEADWLVNKVFVSTSISEPPAPGFPQQGKVADWAKVQL
jgi:hypothetical protein